MKFSNVSLYPWYYSASAFLAWLPIFFLYFSSYLSLSDVLLLEAAYYITVVILEVPSGYFSDFIGRRITLLIGAVFLVLAIILFLTGKSFIPLLLGQICFAGHMSFVSGTNTVFYYESLCLENKEMQYGEREALTNKWALIAGGLAALLGGWVAGISLSYAYIVALAGAVPALVMTFLFKEPEKKQNERASQNLLVQLRTTIGFLRKDSLAWIFGYYMLMFALVHIPYEFYQPYLDLLEKAGRLNFSSAPVMSGVLYAVAMFISAFAAGRSVRWMNRIGLVNFLLLFLIFMVAIIALMSFVFHPVLILILFFRSFGWSAVKAPINAFITPQISTGQRATFHSMMSLSCRLAFFMLLFGLSMAVPSDQVTDWSSLSLILRICLITTGLFVVPIVILAFRIKLK
jgi:MFS family permease